MSIKKKRAARFSNLWPLWNSFTLPSRRILLLIIILFAISGHFLLYLLRKSFLWFPWPASASFLNHVCPNYLLFFFVIIWHSVSILRTLFLFWIVILITSLRWITIWLGTCIIFILWGNSRIRFTLNWSLIELLFIFFLFLTVTLILILIRIFKLIFQVDVAHILRLSVFIVPKFFQNISLKISLP